MTIPKRVHDRIAAGLKRMLPIVEQQRVRDVSEADTVTLVKDLMSDVLGFDKYAELTSEHAIRGTYCDLAVKLDSKLVLLCEVKAIGTALDDKHVKQAVDYAANQGCEWVILTNGVSWRLYIVTFGKPIDKKLIVAIELPKLSVKNDRDMECLYAFTREGFVKGAHIDLKDKHEATSRHLIGALILENEQVTAMLKRELKRVVDATVDEATIKRVIHDEIFKRDVMDGPEWQAAINRVNRTETRALRQRRAREEVNPSAPAEPHQPPPQAPPA